MSRFKAHWILVALLATAALLLARPGASWSAQDREHLLTAPTWLHPAGTDSLGRDQLTRLSGACLLSLGLSATSAALTTLLAAAVGTLIGLAPGYARSAMRLGCDVILCLPLLFLFMLVRSTLPLNLSPWHSAAVTFALFALLSWPSGARMLAVRAADARGSLWMLQAHASGISASRIFARYVMPYFRPFLLAEFLTTLPLFVLAETNLGLLGLGVGEPLPSWGSMLRDLDNSALIASSHWTYLPLAALMIVMSLLQAASSKEEFR